MLCIRKGGFCHMHATQTPARNDSAASVSTGPITRSRSDQRQPSSDLWDHETGRALQALHLDLENILMCGHQTLLSLTNAILYFTGHGVYTSIDGDLYRGTWQKDKNHGRGVYVWPDGQVYTGDYDNGLREGKG
jgi:hypothetical protein